jgi:hypothetical protein
MVEQRKRRGGRFVGRRVNCEYVPLLPAGIVRFVLHDPREIPYLLVWQDEGDGQIKETVRVSRFSEPWPCDWTGWVEIKRGDGTRTLVRTLERALPRNGGKTLLLACPDCAKLCRGIYGWVPGGQYTTSVYRSHWKCRRCAGLRYASEGGALFVRSRGIIGFLFGVRHSDRPISRYPLVFSSPANAAEAGFCTLNVAL